MLVFAATVFWGFTMMPNLHFDIITSHRNVVEPDGTHSYNSSMSAAKVVGELTVLSILPLQNAKA